MPFLLYITEGMFAVLATGILLGALQSKRFELLLPASAYGVSSAVSLALSSWWPLVIGFSLACLFSAFRVGVEPPQRSSGVFILRNHGVHIWAGIAGSQFFLLSVEGLSFLAIFTIVIQGLDTIALYRAYTGLLATATAEVRKELLVKILWIFTVKVFWYGVVTLLSAAATRSFA